MSSWFTSVEKCISYEWCKLVWEGVGWKGGYPKLINHEVFKFSDLYEILSTSTHSYGYLIRYIPHWIFRACNLSHQLIIHHSTHHSCNLMKEIKFSFSFGHSKFSIQTPLLKNWHKIKVKTLPHLCQNSLKSTDLSAKILITYSFSETLVFSYSLEQTSPVKLQGL